MSADEGDEELLHPWSSLALVHGLDELTESTAIASPLGPSPRRLDEGKLLRFWLERRPDVAARTLLSTVFTDRCFTGRANQNDGVVRRVREMAQHALSVQRRWSCEVQRTTAHLPAAVMEEIPQGEVTFAAQFIYDLILAGGAPDVTVAVERVLRPAGDACKAITNSHGENDVQDVLSAHLRSLHTLAHHAGTRSPAVVTTQTRPPIAQDQGQRRTLSLRVSASAARRTRSMVAAIATPRRRDGDDDVDARPHRVRYAGQERGLYDTTVWLGNVPAQERRERLCDVQCATAPLCVRSRDEIAQRAEESAARQSSTTLVRSDRATIAAPQWTTTLAADDVPYENAKANATSAVKTGSSPSAPSEADEVDATQGDAMPPSTATRAAGPQSDQDRGATARNVTWVEAGELAFVNGRVVVLPERPQRGGAGRGPPQSNTRSSVVGGVAHKRRGRPPRGVTTLTEAALGAHTYPDRPSTRRGKRGRAARHDAVPHGRGGGAAAAERECVTAVSTQHVELKTRDELRALVGQWNISTTLREALLIGLETSLPGSDGGGGATGGGERSRGGVLRLQCTAQDVPKPPSHKPPPTAQAQDDEPQRAHPFTPAISSASFASATWVASSSDEHDTHQS